MTKPLPPDDLARLDALYRERNPDPQQLASERHRPVPAPPGYPVPARVRGTAASPPPPTAPPSYAAAHADLREWVRTEHPMWLPELFTLGDAVAHVVIEREQPSLATALCGETGYPHAAPDIAPPCPLCKSFRPRR